MNANQIKEEFKSITNEDITRDSIAASVGLRDLYYLAEKYEVSAESFADGMKRYFARCGYNAQKSQDKLSAFEYRYIKGDDFGEKDTFGFSR